MADINQLYCHVAGARSTSWTRSEAPCASTASRTSTPSLPARVRHALQHVLSRHEVHANLRNLPPSDVLQQMNLMSLICRRRQVLQVDCAAGAAEYPVRRRPVAVQRDAHHQGTCRPSRIGLCHVLQCDAPMPTLEPALDATQAVQGAMLQVSMSAWVHGTDTLNPAAP